MRRRSGNPDAATAWQHQQHVAALRAAASAIPTAQQLPVKLQRVLGQVFASLAAAAGQAPAAARPAAAAAAADKPSHPTGGAPEGAGRELPDSSTPAVPHWDAESALQAAVRHLQSAVREHAGQFAASLLHAHLFMAWEAVWGIMDVDAPAAAAPRHLQPAGSSGRSDSGASNSSASSARGSGEYGNREPPRIQATADPWGPCAPWRLSSSQYGHLVLALGWQPLLLDMLAWLPCSCGREVQADWQQHLMAQALAACPRLAPGILATLSALNQPLQRSDSSPPAAALAAGRDAGSTGGQRGELASSEVCAWQPHALWALPLLVLQQHASCIMEPIERVQCLLQLSHAAVWALSAPQQSVCGADDARPLLVSQAALQLLRGEPATLQQQQQQQQQCGAPENSWAGQAEADVSSTFLVATAMQLLEQLLCDWQADVFASASGAASPSGGAALAAALHTQLQCLQQLAKQRLAVLAQEQQTGQQQCEHISLQTVSHLSMRVTMALMFWPAAVAAAAPAAVTPAAAHALTPAQQQRQWQALAADPLRPGALSVDSSSSSCSSSDGAWLSLVSGQVSSSSQQQLSSIARLASWAAPVAGACIGTQPAGEPQAAAPPLPPPSLAAALVHRGLPQEPGISADALSEHLAALAAAWLAPGVPCWWALPCAAPVVGAAQAASLGPLQLTAVLVDMLAHCAELLEQQQQQQQEGGAPISLQGLAPDPQLPALLLRMLVHAGAQVASRQQQAELLQAVYAPQPSPMPLAPHTPGTPAAQTAATQAGLGAGTVQRLQAWLSRQTGLRSAASRALVGVLNRQTAQDAAAQLVVLSRQQQAELVAEMAKELLVPGLLWPGLVVAHLLETGVQHRGMLPLVLDLLEALRPMVTSPAALPAAPSGAAAAANELTNAAAVAMPAAHAMPLSLLLEQLAELLLGPQAVNATAAEGSTATQLVAGLVATGLVAPADALHWLVALPLQRFAGASSPAAAPLPTQATRLMLSLATALLKLPAPGGRGEEQGAGGLPAACLGLAAGLAASEAVAASALLRGADWPALLMGLCAASSRLQQQARQLGQLDYPTGGQAHELLAAMVQLLSTCPSAAAAVNTASPTIAVPAAACGAGAPSPKAPQQSEVKQLFAQRWVAGEFAALPWQQRAVLLPLLPTLLNSAAAEQQLHLEGLQPASLRALRQLSSANGASSSLGDGAGVLESAMQLMRDCCDMAAASEGHAAALAAAFYSRTANSAGTTTSSSTRRDAACDTWVGEVAAQLAAAAVQLPEAVARQGLLLALGQVLPFASEAQAARLLLVALPAAAPALLPMALPAGGAAGVSEAGSTPADPHHSSSSSSSSSSSHVHVACLELAIRGCYLFLQRGSWCRLHPQAAQPAAEQCFRHLSTLALRVLAADRQLAGRCLAEVCGLASALQGDYECTPLQPLLLRMLSALCQHAGRLAKAGPAQQAKEGAARTAAAAQQLLSVKDQLLSASEQLRRLPSALEAPLRAALVMMTAQELEDEGVLHALEQ